MCVCVCVCVCVCECVLNYIYIYMLVGAEPDIVWGKIIKHTLLKKVALFANEWALLNFLEIPVFLSVFIGRTQSDQNFVD